LALKINLKNLWILPRLILGGTFIYASIDKIANPEGFVQIVENYQILPEFIVEGFARFLPWAELVLGTLLVTGILVRISALIVSFLLLVFMIAIAIKGINGTLEICGCFSSSSVTFKSNAIFFILRDVLLLFLGFIIIYSSKVKNWDVELISKN